MKKIIEVWNRGTLISQEEIDNKTDDQKSLRTAYISAINDLTTIINASSMTNAQLLATVQREAEILRGILKYFKDEIQN